MMVSTKAADPATAIPQHDFADILVSPRLGLHLVRSADPALELRFELTYRLHTAPLQMEYVLTERPVTLPRCPEIDTGRPALGVPDDDEAVGKRSRTGRRSTSPRTESHR
jgi:hypothetical protein